MSIAFVRTSGQIATTSPLGGGAISLSITPPAVGNTVLVAVATAAATGAASCSDASGTTYSLDAEITDGTAITVMVFSARVTTSGVLSIKINGFGASLVVEAAAFEFSGIKSTSRLDTKGTGSGIGTEVSAGPTVENLIAGNAWIAVFGSTASSSTFTAEGASSLPSTDQVGGSLGAEYVLSPTIGSKATAKGEFSTTGTWAGLIIAYKAEPINLSRSGADSAVTTESLSRTLNFPRMGRETLLPSPGVYPGVYPGYTVDSSYTADFPVPHSTFQPLNVGDVAESLESSFSFIHASRSISDSSLGADASNRIVSGVRLIAEEIDAIDGNERIVQFSRTTFDISNTSDNVFYNLLIPRSSSDTSSSTDSVSYKSKRARIASDASEDADMGSRYISLKRATGNDPLDPGNTVYPGNLFPGNQTIDMAETIDHDSRTLSLFKNTLNNAIAVDSDLRDILHFSRTSNDASHQVDITTRGNQNFVRSAADIESTTDATSRGVISFHRILTDTSLTSDANIIIRTLFRRGNDTAVFITSPSLSRVSYNMGYLIWATDAGNLLQPYSSRMLKKEPINELRIFEGKVLPRTNEPDVFSYQLTSYPLSVNKPRQQTTEI